MAEDHRPPLPSYNSLGSSSDHGDPFADRPRQVNFTEPSMSAYESSVSLPHEFGGMGGGYEDEEVEKLPLTAAAGTLYPPGYVQFTSRCLATRSAVSGVQCSWVKL